MKSRPSDEKLLRLRASMEENSIDTYIIPTGDPNTGEYVPDNWKIIPWLTGFTGSAATVAVTRDFAGLWTDPRYYIQAKQQLGNSEIRFMEPVSGRAFGLSDWLSEFSEEGSTLGIDGRIITENRLRNIEKTAAAKKIGIYSNCDLVSGIWTDRPEPPVSPAFDFPVAFSGKDRTEKINEVRDQMKKTGADYHFISALDDIMWMLNIRGSDLKYSPLFTSFALVSHEQVLLFADEARIPLKLSSGFDRIGVVVLPYEEADSLLAALPSRSKILISPSTVSAALFRSIKNPKRIIEGPSIPARLKAVKNQTEIDNIGRSMLKDGIALTRFFCWLENYSGKTLLTELDLAEKLEEFRGEQEGYLGPSFGAIVAFNSHGAQPHYSASPESNIQIVGPGLLLVDSGGQYLEGTTDITRTISLGKPSAAMKTDFTLVLKGHIGLASAKMPAGTKGLQVDALARRPLWESGLNYGHGTGHGVGFCLNVHEAPPSISPADTAGSGSALEPGMLISNEPALYREGLYGIRTENLILCREDEETEYGGFLRFDTVSLCYIDTNLLDLSMLGRDETEWLNRYHEMVFKLLGPLIPENEKIWLRRKTAPLQII